MSDRMHPDDLSEIKRVIHTEAINAAESVSEKQIVAAIFTTMQALGIDVDNKLEVQKDFAYLRGNRLSSEDTKKSAKDAIVRWSLTATVAAIVAYISTHPTGAGGQ